MRESMKSVSSKKSTVSYEMLTELNCQTRLFYSFGHIYNDLCASVWFSYTLLYFKLNFDDSIAGMLLLLGITLYYGYKSVNCIIPLILIIFSKRIISPSTLYD